jgi:pimeloyl-ACP methyl ester carboxylesterase
MDLFYRKYGKGRPLIILHGVLGISDNWVTFGRRMAAKGFEVIIPDQRNHGQSPHHHTFNYYALVDDLSELIEGNNIESPVIIGHSMGGKVAMRYTLENPEMVKALIVVDTSLRTYVRFNYHQALIDAMLSVDLKGVKSRSDAEERLSTKIQDLRLRQFLMKNLYWKEKDTLGWRSNLEAIRENLESMYDGVFYSTRYDGPAIFIRGGRSDYVLEDDFPAIEENFPGAEIVTIENGTHWVHADEPDKFFEIASRFLEKIKF